MRKRGKKVEFKIESKVESEVEPKVDSRLNLTASQIQCEAESNSN